MPGNISSKAPAIAVNAIRPRGWGGLGGVDKARWLGGAPALEGKGRIPNITPGGLTWSAGEIADYLETGFTPDYDSVGGSMVEVQDNMAKLSDTDRRRSPPI